MRNRSESRGSREPLVTGDAARLNPQNARRPRTKQLYPLPSPEDTTVVCSLPVITTHIRMVLGTVSNLCSCHSAPTPYINRGVYVCVIVLDRTKTLQDYQNKRETAFKKPTNHREKKHISLSLSQTHTHTKHRLRCTKRSSLPRGTGLLKPAARRHTFSWWGAVGGQSRGTRQETVYNIISS